LEGLVAFLSDVEVLELDHAVARRFGEVRAGLLDAGLVLPTTDLLIACTALTHDLTMVTHNIAHFARVPGLRLQDWLNP